MYSHLLTLSCILPLFDDIKKPYEDIIINDTKLVIPLTPHPIDYDNDGDMDIIIGNGFSQLLSPYAATIMENDGYGNFTGTNIDLSMGASISYPTATEVIDTNNDGYDDFLAVDLESRIRIWHLGPNGFSNQQVYGPIYTNQILNSAKTTAIAKGDFNNDGDNEIIIAISEVRVFFGNLPLGIYIIDFDNQGLVNNQHFIPNTGGEIGAFKLLDINNDQNLDIIMIDCAGFIKILLGNGNFSFQTPVIINTGHQAVLDHLAVNDIDNDGDIDLIVAYQDKPEIEIYENDGNLNFSRSTININNSGVYFMDMYNIDNDNDKDLIIIEANSTTSNATVYLNENGRFSYYGSTPSGIHQLGASPSVSLGVIEDFDGNATPDLLVSRSRTTNRELNIGLLKSLFNKPYIINHGGVGSNGSNGPISIGTIGPAIIGSLHFKITITNGIPFSPLLIMSSPWTQNVAIDPMLNLLVVPVAFEPGITDNNGYFEFLVPIYNDPVLHNEWGYSQALIVDTGANNYSGVASSDRLEVRIGTRN